ncbi:exonuclease [Dictyocaulus viviparus]|uniref:Exonuclease n=1 Tax=Dictyocaulus viviparus TaxID=29172 RepID=A0A0D8XG07_DICVI|nr:exonuclease [Dictyocaulus viviparus]
MDNPDVAGPADVGSGAFLYASTIETNALNPTPITALRFDPFEELLWCGNCTGRIASYYAPSFERYTAVCATTGDVRAMEVTEMVVLSLSPNELKANTRHGLVAFSLSTESMQNLNSMQLLAGTTSLFVGGDSTNLIHLDLEKQKEVRVAVIKEKNANLIRLNGSQLFTADTEGKITLRAPGSMDTIRVIPAHSGAITDFDVSGNKLITSGCSIRLGVPHGDPYVKVYDLRNFSALPPIPLSFAPAFSRFLPLSTFCDSCVISVGQTGQGLMMFLNERNLGMPMFIDAGGYHLTAFDFSTTKHYLAFGDEIGALGPPQSFLIDDTHTPLAAIPLPFSCDDTYFSDWPAEYCQNVYRRTKPLPTHQTMSTIQFVGYAPNPRAHTPLARFNIVPYCLDDQESFETIEAPGPPIIPQFYRKIEFRRSRNGRLDDCTILKYNKTNHVPMETVPSSSIINPIVLLLFHTIALRNLFFSHFCEEEHCIVCQLGFVCRIISDKSKLKESAACTNLIRSLAVSGVSMVGPVLSTTQSLFSSVIESISNFVIAEERETLARILQSELTVLSRCIRCGEVNASDEKKIIISLNYPEATDQRNMSYLLEKSLHLKGQHQESCAYCNVSTRMDDTRRVQKLAPILLIDTNPTSPKFFEFWEKQLKMSESRPRYRIPDKECCLEGGGRTERPCRYGVNCRNRSYCKYSHGTDDWDLECAIWLEDSGCGDWKHFLAPSFGAKVANGLAILSEDVTENDCDRYELVAIIAAVGDQKGQWTHSITMIKDKEDIEIRLPIPCSVFQTDTNLTGNDEVARCRRFLEIPGEGEYVGIDAEFINISNDHERKSVGRVSCVNSTGEQILIDDYVVTCEGDVVDDYLTQYSGIMEDDLDPNKSTKHLTTLKRVYMKVLHLVERGCIFVGHALVNDFSALNIHVPMNQMIDTVELFRVPQQRLFSLQFLAWHLLGEKIQFGIHDSVEDARVALKLFRKWQELSRDGTLDSVLTSLYTTGKQMGWRVDHTPSKSKSPLSEISTSGNSQPQE